MEMNAVQTNTKPTAKEQGYSVRETELIQELIKARLEHKAELEHESLEGYELPPRTQFSMLKKPALTIKYGYLKFNMACVHLFEGVQYILPIVNRARRRIAVVTCAEEESASVQWARQRMEFGSTGKSRLLRLSKRSLRSWVGTGCADIKLWAMLRHQAAA